MEPNSFGKKLGIGVRVAGRIARQRAAETAQRTQAQPRVENAAVRTVPLGPNRAEVAADLKERGRTFGHGLGRGTKNFGQHFFGPFAHAGGVLWLEITGCFFALFALFFGQNVYLLRAQYAAGPLHQKFVLYAGLTLVFLYFSGTSFAKARLKARRRRAGR